MGIFFEPVSIALKNETVLFNPFAMLERVSPVQAGIRLPGNEYFRYFPWDGDYYEKNRYYQLNHS